MSIPRALVACLIATVAFALTYTQAPLYYSNQQQYFLHGLAVAGHGQLDQDWLANTTDPAPVFSAIVRVTVGSLDESLFYVYYALVQSVYFLSLWGIFRVVSEGWRTPAREVAFLLILLTVHSAAIRVASTYLLGTDYPFYLQSGVAGQYLLGPVFQPSTFGVLLLASLWAYLTERRFLAVTLAALAAVSHATYLLLAGIFVLSYLVTWTTQGRGRLSVLLGLWALLLVIPTLTYSWTRFYPEATEMARQARQILVEYRIPHHASPRRWFDVVAAIQIGWMLVGIALARGTRLFPVLAMIFGLGTVLTLIQIGTGNPFLALLFPWRVSVILVPIATLMVITRLVGIGSSVTTSKRWGIGPTIALTTGTLGLVLAGIVIMARPLGFHVPEEELPILGHVREHQATGDVYLLPIKEWKPSPPWQGSKKSDFNPPPKRRTDPQFIPIDLQRFRIDTGAPIYVDFKSIPYKDAEVIEWRERLRHNHDWHRRLDQGHISEVVEELRANGVSHVVRRADGGLTHPMLKREFDDGVYHVYRVVTPSP